MPSRTMPEPADQTTMSELTTDEILRQLDIRAPRYTSFPTADRFNERFGADELARQLGQQAFNSAAPLSIYVHIPFCESLCYFCACNKVITRNHDKAAPYLRRIEKELDLVLAHLPGRRQIAQIHWGGGSPGFLRPAESRALMGMFTERFDIAPDGEYSIEIDPRIVDDHQIALLADIGFNRMSLGVQDFHPEVQKAVNRIQPVEVTRRVLEQARQAGFESTNFDLIYGLPCQTVDRFAATMQSVVSMRPERIALYNYAHLPSTFKAQRLIPDDTMPSAAEKLAIFQMAVEALEAAGYDYIGMDHFALPDDELAVARRDGRLHRNFQGYSTRRDCDLIALGASAISKIGNSYSQNLRGVKDYCDAVDAGRLPTLRGIELTPEDVLRRELIMELMCQARLDKASIAARYQISFDETFAAELATLQRYADLGLVQMSADAIVVTDSGQRKALRAISAIFDQHLQADPKRQAFSRVL